MIIRDVNLQQIKYECTELDSSGPVLRGVRQSTLCNAAYSQNS
jgi:hypothetical protein